MEKRYYEKDLERRTGLPVKISFSGQYFEGTLRRSGEGIYYVQKRQAFMCLIHGGEEVVFNPRNPESVTDTLLKILF